MKHPVELYPDFSSLSDYLRNIEVLAENLGVDVDDLLRDNTERKLAKRRKVLYMNRNKSRQKQDGLL